MSVEEIYVSSVYTQISKHFDNTRHYKWNWITNFIEKTEENSIILDMGCGNGRNMNYNRNIIGIDNCKEFVDICKSKGYNVIQCDITVTPYMSNSFNYIINIAVFHHLSTEQRRLDCLKEIYRILKPNGEVLLSVWSKNQPKKTKKKFQKYGDNYVPWVKENQIFERYYYIFQIEEIKNLFKICNFKIKDHFWDCGNEIFILTK